MRFPKKVWNIIIVAAVVSFNLFFATKSKREREAFLRNELKNTIIKVKLNWTGRGHDYVVDNGIVFFLYKDESLLVGDSIVKKYNTNKIDVYRRKNGEYEFYKSLNVGVVN
jgi:hypothetical protein